MRFKSLALSTASLGAMLLGASPALAVQTAPPATPTDPSAGAQTNPADPVPATGDAVQAAPADAVPAEEETIVVTGLRRSLQSARNIKRSSEQIVDAIVAEDIGKLPDVTVSDTAARIPGIQVERNGGEASRVLVRGLGREFYTTTYNGREIFTAETRSVALQDFPAGAIAAVEAFKTSTADLVEPGLAGLVNVRSRRPFDFSKPEIAGSAWVQFPNQSRDAGVNGNLLLSDRWDVGGGEIGALISASYTELHYKDSIRRHGFFIADVAGARSPDWPEIRYNEARRSRPSINAAFQWRPSSNLQFFAEGLWQGFREKSSDRLFNQPLWNGGQAVYSNLVLQPGTNNLASGTVFRPGVPGLFRGFQGATSRKTNTYQFAVGGSYDAGPLKITADLARTSSQFDLRTESVDYSLNTNNFFVDFVIGEVRGAGPTFQVRGIDLTNPAFYNYNGFFEEYLTAKGKDLQGRLDFEYEPGLSFVPKIQFGVRGVERDASRNVGSVFWDVASDNISIGQVPLNYQLFTSGFRGDKDRPFPITWFAPTYSSVQQNLRALRQFNIDRRGAGGIDGGTINGPNQNPNRGFDINERSLAAYAQLNYGFDVGSVPVDGVIGLRVVQTRDRISGTTTVGGANPTPIEVTNKYTDWLPNLNFRAKLTPELFLRFAATKTRSRPLFEQLNPSLSFDQVQACAPNQTNCNRTASGGNPFLKPIKSNNYDAALEYYFSRTGLASVTAFRRDLKGFIANRNYTFPTPDVTTGRPLLISGPINTRRGRIDGVEAQVRTFFDFDFVPEFARSFGAEANFTYLNAKADFDLFRNTPNAVTRSLYIPDVSKYSYNLVGMYENAGFTARLSYNWRGRYAEGDLSERDNFFTLQGRGRGGSRLDWSSSYNFSDKFTVFADWTNILKTPFKSDIVREDYSGGKITRFEEFPLVYRFEESIVTGGVRFRF
jgi:TonB-dependent receptor